MALVKVWNDNVYPYKELFKGDNILIPPNSYIEMEHDDAILFKGTYCMPKYDAGGAALPETFKKIRITSGTEGAAKQKIEFYKCQACNYEATNMVDLDKHITENHLEQLADTKERDKRKGKK